MPEFDNLVDFGPFLWAVHPLELTYNQKVYLSEISTRFGQPKHLSFETSCCGVVSCVIEAKVTVTYLRRKSYGAP